MYNWFMLYPIAGKIMFNFNTDIPTVKDHHIIKISRTIAINKLHPRELYSFFIKNAEHQPASQIYFGTLFSNEPLDWNIIYILPRNVTISVFVRNFQYKMLNNILYLNKKLISF